MTKIYIESESVMEIERSLRSAIKGEVSRLAMALDAARQRLHPFEENYGVTSAQFITRMVAEDLDGGDDEYVQWAGEYKLMERLAYKLGQLGDIEYGDSKLLHAS